MKRRKIAVLLPNLRGGGAENMRVKLAKDWISKGYLVEFILLDATGILIESLPNEVSLIDLKASRISSSIRPLTEYLKSTDSDVILVGMWPLTVIAGFAKVISRSSINLVVSEHSILSKSFYHKGIIHDLLMRLSMMIFYRVSTSRIGVSKGVVKEMSRLSCLPENMFDLIYNPAYSDYPYVDNYSSFPRYYKTIITAGSFKKVKNHKLLIEAFSKLCSSKEGNYKLVILGDGKLRGEYLKLIDALGIYDLVELPGYKEDPRDYFISSDLFVLSSDHEGLGNVIIEALGCGLPIVSTDCESGPREILTDGKYGTLVPVGDVSALADAMFDALNSSHDTNALKLRAKDFSIDKISQRYLDIMFPKEDN